MNAADWKKLCRLEAITGIINLVPFLHFQITATHQAVGHPPVFIVAGGSIPWKL